MRVLIADQDSTLLEALARALGDEFSVDIATSKTTCIDLLRAQNEFCVIVASERLTDGSGLELLGQMEKRWPSVLRVFAIEPARLPLIGTRLKPFKLFHTMAYPMDADRLRNVLLLAQAAQNANADTAEVEHIVMGDGEEEEPAVATGAVPSARGRGAAVTPISRAPTRVAQPRPATRSPAPQPMRAAPTSTPPLPPIRGERRIGERRAGERRATLGVDFPPIDSLAEASQMAAALKAAGGPKRSEFRLNRLLIPVGLVVVVAGGVFAYVKMNSRDAAPAVGVRPPTLASEPTTAPGVRELVTDIESALTTDDFATARAGVNKLRQLVPDHPRLAFLEALVRRGEESQRLAQARAAEAAAPQRNETGQSAASAQPQALALRPATTPEAVATPPVTASSAGASVASSAAPEPVPVSRGDVFEGRTLEESPVPAAAEPAIIETPTTVAAPAPATVSPPAASGTAAVETPAVAPRQPPAAVETPAAAPRQPAAPVVVAARLIKQVAPEYPRAAEREGIEGFVELSVSISATGTVEDVQVLNATPPETFDRAAINAVRKWKYSPRTENGTPVPSQTKTRIEFQLAKK